MADDLLPLYERELTFLRQHAAEFAAKYPKIASRLLLEADKCEDPHVERLIEGFAFLTARIQHKIEDEFPEITDALLRTDPSPEPVMFDMVLQLNTQQYVVQGRD